MQDEAERIAASLTKAQREAVVNKLGAHEIVTSAPLDPLWFGITKLGADQFLISLTPLGRRVRTILQQREG